MQTRTHHLELMLAESTLIKVAPVSVATALASMVLPVPKHSTPGHRRPYPQSVRVR